MSIMCSMGLYKRDATEDEGLTASTYACALISEVVDGGGPEGFEEKIIYLKDVFYGRIKCFCPHQFISIKANAFERTHISNHTLLKFMWARACALR